MKFTIILLDWVINTWNHMVYNYMIFTNLSKNFDVNVNTRKFVYFSLFILELLSILIQIKQWKTKKEEVLKYNWLKKERTYVVYDLIR